MSDPVGRSLDVPAPAGPPRPAVEEALRLAMACQASRAPNAAIRIGLPRQIIPIGLPNRLVVEGLRMPGILPQSLSALVVTGCLLLGGCVSAAPTGGPAAQVRDIRIRCIDDIDKADPDRQAAMAAGTIVGMVTGIAAGQGAAGIALVGAYVGCEMGEAFIEAYKADADRATVLLDPSTFGFEQAPAGQRLIVYTGKMPHRSVGGARRQAGQAARTGFPAEAAFRTVVPLDRAVSPTGRAAAASLTSAGLDPTTAAAVAHVVDSVGAAGRAAVEIVDDAARKNGRGCWGYC